MSKDDASPATKPRRYLVHSQSPAPIHVHHKALLASTSVRKALRTFTLALKPQHSHVCTQSLSTRSRLPQSLECICVRPQSLSAVLSAHKALVRSCPVTQFKYPVSMVSTSHIGLVVLPTDCIVKVRGVWSQFRQCL